MSVAHALHEVHYMSVAHALHKVHYSEDELHERSE